jgi:multiple sugar transport system substrate-binding protein
MIYYRARVRERAWVGGLRVTVFIGRSLAQWCNARIGAACLWLCVCALPAAANETIVINSNASDPAPRRAWESVVEQFRRENPSITVRLNVYDHESYKKSLRNWLTSASPDVVFWNVGHRMRQLVAPGLLADVSELFTPEMKAAVGPAALAQVTVAGRQYGVPVSYYHIGLYYRRDLLEAAGIARAPRDWADLLAACTRLRQAGLEPIAIGSRDLWPTAAWFDYLNLRINGYDFHMQLMDGRVAYNDRRVRAVFARWRELLERGCFQRHHASMSWQESQALMNRDRAAMTLIGNFMVASLPPDVRDKTEFAPFPTVAAGIGRYEEAPMNSLHIPARARNPDGAKRFLAFVLRPEVQERINRALLQIPVHRGARIAEDRFLHAGRRLLEQADNLTQYFDRDTSEDLAAIAMKGFQEFMLRPDRLDAILANIERARQRIYDR